MREWEQGVPAILPFLPPVLLFMATRSQQGRGAHEKMATTTRKKHAGVGIALLALLILGVAGAAGIFAPEIVGRTILRIQGSVIRGTDVDYELDPIAGVMMNGSDGYWEYDGWLVRASPFKCNQGTPSQVCKTEITFENGGTLENVNCAFVFNEIPEKGRMHRWQNITSASGR